MQNVDDSTACNYYASIFFQYLVYSLFVSSITRLASYFIYV